MITRRITLLIAFSIVLIAAATARAQDASNPSAVGPLLRILQSGNLPEDRLAFIFEVIADKGNAYDASFLFQKVIAADGFQGKSRLAAMRALVKAARVRGVKPAGDVSKLAALIHAKLAQDEPPVYESAIELAGLWKVEAAAAALREISNDAQMTLRRRRLAMDALAGIGGDAAREAINQLAAKDQPQAIRYLGAAALAKIDAAAASPVAVKILADGTAKDDPASLIDAFLEQTGGAEKLAAALQKAEQALPADVAKLALRHMYALGRTDAALVDALSKAAGISTEVKPLGSAEMQSLIADVQAKGDADRGEAIFRRADLNCIKCHALNGAGGNVGPDLVDLGGRQPLDYLIESIMIPEKAVKEDFQLAQVTDYATGKQHQGILKEESAERIVLKGAQGEQIIVAIEDPDDVVVKKGGSLMPQGIVRFLTREEIVDLVKFLSVLGQGETPYAKSTAPIMRRWRVLSEVPAELAADSIDDEAFLDHVQAADETRWQPVYARVDGTLPVHELATGDSPIVLLQGEIEVTSPGDVRLKLLGAPKTIVWIDDVRVVDSKNLITRLNAGRHPVTLRVNARKCDAAGITLRLAPVEGSAAKASIVGGL